MNEDQTQQYANPAEQPPAPATEVPAAEAPATAAPATAAPANADPAADTVAPPPTGPVTPAAAGASRGRWLAAIGVAGVILVAGIAALLLFGKPSTPEALTYVPGDAALVMELRPELPGDQMQALGNFLAHFPGFQDQSTLTQKIDEALKRIIAEAPGSSVDYEKDVKPFLSGPMFVSIRSLEDMETSQDPKNFVVIASSTGTVTCEKTFEGETVTTEPYNGLQLSIASGQKAACAIDGRFVLVGDPAGVKAAIDTRKGGAGKDKDAQYQAARKELGLDRLATIYLDGASLAKVIPSSAPGAPAVGDLVAALPKWVMVGMRAENDAFVTDIVVAPPANPAAMPSFATNPPAHPISFTAFAPADSLAFVEIQGFGASMHNVLAQLQSDPQFSEALKQLDMFGGLDGLIGWIEDAGIVVFRDGETPAGGLILGAKDAAGASEKVTALTTVLGLAASGGGVTVTTAEIEGVKVTNVHVDDLGSLTGGVTGGVPAGAFDFSIAAKDRYVVVGVGTNAMAKMLGVKAGSGLADDAAFKRALGRALPNPQIVMYVAAGSALDWLKTAAAGLGAGDAIPADLKPYLDPLEGLMYTTTGDGLHGGSLRLALTVAN